MIVTLENFSKRELKGFIAIEGANGGGKSTLQKNIANYLTDHQKEVVCTLEPGGTTLGKSIRSLLLGVDQEVDPVAEMFLFAADRAHHVNTKIKPALEQGKFVLTDRYYYSSIAFQGFGREMDWHLVDLINQIAISNCIPDLVILLDLSPEEGLKRTQKRDAVCEDRLEQEPLDFHNRLRMGFLELAESKPELFLVIDATKSKEAVFGEVKPYLDALLQK